MKNEIIARILLPSQAAVLALASAIAIPAMAQQTQQPDNSSQSAPAAAQQQPTSTPPATANQSQPIQEQKEGFWGRVNPMARKKWVKKRLDPINDRLTELDQVNSKNASDIKDVAARAPAGIKKAQDSAE